MLLAGLLKLGGCVLYRARANVAGRAPQGVRAALGTGRIGFAEGGGKALAKLCLAVTEFAQQAAVKRLVVHRGRQPGLGVNAGKMPAPGLAWGFGQASWRRRDWARGEGCRWPDPLGHGGEHGRHVERLGNVVAHAGFDHLVAVAGHGIGGHGDDGDLRQGQVLANLAGGGVAVHDRHLAVHQHAIKAIVPGQNVQRLLAVVGHQYRDAGLLQQFQRQFLVHVVVFHQQHARARQLGHGLAVVVDPLQCIGFFQVALVQGGPNALQQG